MARCSGSPTPARSLDLRFVPPVEPIRSGTGARQQQVTTPVAVVVVGHFYDERYSRCPAELLATCEQTFVVDAVATSTGVLNDPAATSAGRGEAGRLTASDVVEIARRRLAASGEVLAVGLAFGSDPPWFSPAPSADRPGPATWFVRGYRILSDGTTDRRGPGTPVAGWLAIDDAHGRGHRHARLTATRRRRRIPAALARARLPGDGRRSAGPTVVDATAAGRLRSRHGRAVAVAGWLTQLPLHPCPSPVGCDLRARHGRSSPDIRRASWSSYGPGRIRRRLVQPAGAGPLSGDLLPGSPALPAAEPGRFAAASRPGHASERPAGGSRWARDLPSVAASSSSTRSPGWMARTRGRPSGSSIRARPEAHGQTDPVRILGPRIVTAPDPGGSICDRRGSAVATCRRSAVFAADRATSGSEPDRRRLGRPP